MIEQTYASKRVKNPPVLLPPKNFVSQYAVFQAKLRDITPEEFVRRETILSRLSLDCKLQTGDTVFPVTKDGFEKYGSCYVVGVARTMRDLGTEYTWPESDNPMIITLKCSKQDNHIFCTTNFVTKRNFHAETCL